MVAQSPELGLEVVLPSESIRAEPPVALVDRNAERHGTTELARAYLAYLFEPGVQEIAARRSFRPSDPDVLERHRAHFPELTLFTVEEQFGGWQRAHREHFADGARFDQLEVGGAALGATAPR